MTPDANGQTDLPPTDPADRPDTPRAKRPGIRRKKLPVLKKLAFLLVILVGTWLLLEFGLILAGISFPLLYQPDAQVATLLKPNLNVRYTEEGNAIVQTNSRGFRDLERNRRGKEEDR